MLQSKSLSAHKLLLTILGLLMVTSFSLPALAQTTGSILGRVADPSGAVIPNATVRVTNMQTQAERTTTTDTSGNYRFTLLPVGRYRVTAEAPGFVRSQLPDVLVDVEQHVRVDVGMTIGNLKQEVVVSSEVPQVDTTTATLGKVVEERRIADLPLNGRNFLELGDLQAGVTPPTPGIDVIGSGTNKIPGGTDVLFSVNGIRYNANNFLLDGVNNVEPITGAAMIVPSPDSLQEFRILTNLYDAQYGRAGGSVVTILTKSGTNQFHGSAYDFLRNDFLDARNYFAPHVPKLRQNQFGATLGGPIIKNKTFFFASYEGFRQSHGIATTATVPTLAERAGNFNASAVKPFNPFTKAPFPNNTLPSLNSIGQAILNLYPQPNLGSNQWSGAPVGSNNADQFLGKIDHSMLGGKNNLSGRYALSQANLTQPVNFFTVGSAFTQVPGFANADVSRFQNVSLSDTHVISQRTVNEFRVSYQRARVQAGQPKNPADRSSVGFTFPISGTPVSALPAISLSGFSGLGYPLSSSRKTNMYEFLDNISWTLGNHNLRFGGDVRHTLIYSNFPSLAWGGYFFVGAFSGNAVADVLLGVPFGFIQAGGRPDKTLTNTSEYFYGQDSWRISQRFTATFGLRYELVPGYSEKNNLLLTFVPGVKSVQSPTLPVGLVRPGDPGVPDTVYNTDKHMFAPRIGIAWDPTGGGKSSVRAGYGIFWDEDSLVHEYSVQQPPDFQPILFPIFPTITPTPFGPPGTMADPFGGHSPFTAPVNFPLPVAPGVSATWTDPNFRPAYIQQWNLTVQRQITPSLALEAAYVGTKGTHLQGVVEPNQAVFTPTATSGNVNSRRPIPNLGETFQVSSIFNSNYNAFQLTATQRLWRGLSFQASYTWSKSLDYQSAPNSFYTIPGQPRVPQDSTNLKAEYGPSAFDIPHRFVVSYLYELPFFRGSSGFVKSLFGNWRLTGIMAAQSGTPFTVLDSSNPDLGGGSTIRDRVNVVADPFSGTCSNGAPTRTPQCWVNPSAFKRLVPPALGNERRNMLRSGSIFNWDMGLEKEIPIHERQRLELRWEVFNIFNHANFAVPITDFASPNFGKVQGTSTPEREMQLALKFIF